MTTRTRSTRTAARLTPPASSQSELERIVAPTSADEFLAAFWERQPLVVSRSEEGRFDDLLSEQDVERLLCETGLRYPAFRLVKAGEQIALGDYTTDVPWNPQPFSKTVNVDPLTVLVSVLVGVELFGFLGALLAIPIAGMIQVVIRNLYDPETGRFKKEPTIGESETPISAARGDAA